MVARSQGGEASAVRQQHSPSAQPLRDRHNSISELMLKLVKDLNKMGEYAR